uniref:SH2 domain-containing protein n=1 Tax=Bursaphelenchus xylophilus TaxID=6326 RepID=A0A1I7S6F3_BURXY
MSRLFGPPRIFLTDFLSRFVDSELTSDEIQLKGKEKSELAAEKLQNLKITVPEQNPQTAQILRKYFLGFCTPSRAESLVRENSDFRLYMRNSADLTGLKDWDFPEIADKIQLTMIHRHFNGVYSHYPIEQADVNGNKRFYVDYGGQIDQVFPTILSLIKFYKANYILARDFCDVFPKPEQLSSVSSSE